MVGKIVFRNNHLPSTAFWRANSLDTRYLVSDMAKNNVIEMPLSSEAAVIYFLIGGKQYPLRIPQRSDRASGGSAIVVVINDSNGGRGKRSLVAAPVENNATTQDHHVPENALAAGLTPDNLPSLEK